MTALEKIQRRLKTKIELFTFGRSPTLNTTHHHKNRIPAVKHGGGGSIMLCVWFLLEGTGKLVKVEDKRSGVSYSTGQSRSSLQGCYVCRCGVKVSRCDEVVAQ